MNNQQRRCLTPMFLTLILMVITVTLSTQILLADAPEEKVWTDAPSKAEPEKIGPRTEQVQLDKSGISHIPLYILAQLRR